MLRRRYLAEEEAAQQAGQGKKRMKAIGKVNVPQEAFMAVLNLKED